MNRLDDLLERVSRAARALPGAVELYLYGSTADPGLKDPYADLDLQVLSADYTLSRAHWPWILEGAGELSLACPLLEKPRESVFSILFTRESPYHKVDIGLSDRSLERSFFLNVPHKILLWRQDPPGQAAPSSRRAACLPEPGTPFHFLVGELLGSIRYAKARRRREHLVCWRFLSARLNALLRSYAWDGRSPDFPEPAFTTPFFKALDRQLPEAERLGWLGLVDCRTPRAMDRSLVALTRRLVERLYPGWAEEDTPEARLVGDLVHFVEQELAGAGAPEQP